MSDPESMRGEFNPANPAEVDRLIRAATIRYGERLTLLPAARRQEVLEEARFGAVEAALSYDVSKAKTTKWKTAANRANTIVRRFFRELPRQPQNETDVLERVRRRLGSAGGNADRDDDAGELDLTVLAADDDDDDYDVERSEGLPDEDDAREDEERARHANATGDQETEFVEPTEDELHPLERAANEDAEHFEMRRHLLAAASEPDRTILRNWTLDATEVGNLIGRTGAAVRQRLRRLIDAEIARPEPNPQIGATPLGHTG